MSNKRALVCQLVCANKKHELLIKLNRFDKELFKTFDAAVNRVSDHMSGVDAAISFWDSPIFIINQEDFFLPVMNQKITELAAAFSCEFSHLAKSQHWFYMKQHLLDLAPAELLEREIQGLMGFEHTKMTDAWSALLANKVVEPVFPGFEETLAITPPRYPRVCIRNSAYVDMLLKLIPNANYSK